MDPTEKLERLKSAKPWDKEPVFCFSSDIDWASEDVLSAFFEAIDPEKLKLTVFVTNKSELIDSYARNGKIDTGIHPNFLPGSSHGDTYTKVIDTCLQWSPNAIGFRSHRYFDVNDINELLHDKYGMRFSSNICSTLQPGLVPIVHRSGLLQFPIFFEDGGFLYNKLELNLKKYESYFHTPGLKVINIHPMNYIINPPHFSYMRQIKDTTPRDDYNKMDNAVIDRIANKASGIRNICDDVIGLARQYRIVSMNELYSLSLS